MRLATTIVLLLGLLTVLCSPVVAANFEETIVLGDGSWPGIEAKNAIVAYILENIGYDVERTMLNVPMVLQSLAQGNVDIWLGAWMPTEDPMREGLRDGFEVLRVHVDDAIFITAVPEYVWEAGVRSHADLQEHAEKFDHTIHVGPIGEGGEIALRHAVDEDIYGLGDWEVVNADWPATIAQAERAVEREEWIAFPGWKPHWMNMLLDIKYLEDPEDIWGDAESEIQTLIRDGLREDHPNLLIFLENFDITSEIQSEWLYEIDRRGTDTDTLAVEWIRDNMDLVEEWLEGVVAKNGEPALRCLSRELD